MSDHKWLNLERLVQDMLVEQPVTRQQLAVWGGESPVSELERFLCGWALPRVGMPWSLFQWTDDITIRHNQGLPENLAYLERARIFGPEGDLEVRRSGDLFLWRFAGEPGLPQPAGFDLEEPGFWEAPGRKPLRAYRRRALLWGRRQDARARGKAGWHEDRVSQARLEYPGVTGDRVQVYYIEYLDGGDVELVRYLGLADGPSEQKGDGHA